MAPHGIPINLKTLSRVNNELNNYIPGTAFWFKAGPIRFKTEAGGSYR